MRPEIILGGDWERVAADLPPSEFLCEGLVPNYAKTILHGPPGAGKSAFLWAIGNAVQTGAACLGFRTRKTRVMLLSVDMNVYELNARWGDAFTPLFDVLPMGKFDVTAPRFSTSDLWKQVADHVEEKAVGLILVDAIGGFHSGKSAMDDHTATAVDAALSAWFPKSAVVMLAHDRKMKLVEKGAKPGRGEEDILGSQMWRANCASQLHMFPAGPNVSQIRHEKCQVGPKWMSSIRVYIDESGNMRLWNDAMAQEASRKVEAATKLLGVEALPVGERNEALARYFKVSIRTMRRWCARFEKDEDEVT